MAALTGNPCIGMACDVTGKANIDAVVAATVAAFGGISTLVNNVGRGARHPDPRRSPRTRWSHLTSSTRSAPTQTLNVHGGGGVVRLFG
jgi:NAD(P)-dependent dehydrogenase (short-subunit alcohol dehydrogenase family)